MTRINKAMSMLGICSRRDADQYIKNNSVLLNGVAIKEMGVKVQNGDCIIFNNKTYTFQEECEKKAWIYYKPIGLITSHKDEQNRETVFDDLARKIDQRVISIGRLDLNSQGLLILTNNGEFAQYAESPKTGWTRSYMVRIFGKLESMMIEQIEQGLTVNGIEYAPMRINSIKKSHGQNCWIDCSINEGKNREIRNIFQYFDLQVNRLIRYQYGPYELGNMQSGDVAPVEMIY